MPQFTVEITNLNDGGELKCSNRINVDYTQPGIAGTSTVALATTATATVDPPSFDVDDTEGTVTFIVTVPSGTNEAGKTVTATITNDGEEQDQDQRINISAVCP